MTNKGFGWGVLVGLAGWTLYTPSVQAQELCDGHVCPEAFTCVTTTTTCPAEDATCEVFTETYCQSPECATDADCPTGRRCRVETEVETDDCGTSPPGSGGGIANPAECPAPKRSSCSLAYDLPCETSAQCGPGFTCEPLVDCDCSNPDAPVPPDCACEYTKIKGCYSPIVPCTTSSDCASGWSCVENVDGICNVVGDFHGGCNPGEPPMACIPPGFRVTMPDGAAPTDTPPRDSTANETSADAGGGCSFTGASSTGAGALLGGLSLLLAFARRRRAGGFATFVRTRP